MSLIEKAGRTNGHAQTLTWKDSAAQTWSKLAPRRLHKRYPQRGAVDGWQEWRRYLAGRRQPSVLAAHTADKLSPLTWALPGDLCDSALMAVVAPLWQLEQGKRLKGGKHQSPSAASDAASLLAQRLAEWIGAEPSPIGLAYAIETLAWARALPALAATLDEAAWWGLWDRLVELSQPEFYSPGIVAPPQEHLLASQLLLAELPMTLAYLFPELASAADLGLAGYQAAKQAIEEHVIGEGFLAAHLWDAYRPLFACWTRTWTIARALGKRAAKQASDPPKPFSRPRQYERLLTTTLRLCRPDGSQMMSNEAAGRWNRPLFAAACRLTGRSPAAAAMQVVRPDKRANRPDKRAKSKSAAGKGLCESAAHAELAHAAILRPDWRRNSPRLAVAFNDGVTRLELFAAGQTLLSGDWSLDLMIAGEPAMLGAHWEEICWVSDSDVDYLEIEAKLAGGVRVQRQILLARKDRFLLLCDGVLTPGILAPGMPTPDERTKLEYSAALRLGPDATFEPARETCEGSLLCGKARLRVLPLALPEWRSVMNSGQLAESEGRVRLRQRAQGAGLFAALFFDLDPKRSKQSFTWRRLTVAQELKALPDDVAVGYRVQIGKRQWLVYRSLAPRAARSVLGQHLASEFMTGRFHRSGQVDRMLEVETE